MWNSSENALEKIKAGKNTKSMSSGSRPCTNTHPCLIQPHCVSHLPGVDANGKFLPPFVVTDFESMSSGDQLAAFNVFSCRTFFGDLFFGHDQMRSSSVIVRALTRLPVLSVVAGSKTGM